MIRHTIAGKSVNQVLIRRDITAWNVSDEAEYSQLMELAFLIVVRIVVNQVMLLAINVDLHVF